MRNAEYRLKGLQLLLIITVLTLLATIPLSYSSTTDTKHPQTSVTRKVTVHHEHQQNHEFEEHISSDNPISYIYLETRNMPYRLYHTFGKALTANLRYFITPVLMLLLILWLRYGVKPED